MSEKKFVAGKDLIPGMTFKFGGRIFVVNEIMDPDKFGDRFGWFEATDGCIHEFNIYEEDHVEIRDSKPVRRDRLVKVSAEDINTVLAVLGTLSEQYTVGGRSLQDAVERLKEAIR